MKLVTAYVRYEAFEPIRSSLLAKGYPSISIVEVKGSGRQKGIIESYRGSKVTNYLRPKLKLEIGVKDEDVQVVVDTIVENATSGEIGDGKVFVSDIEQAIRIRTGESGEDVLQAHPSSADAEE